MLNSNIRPGGRAVRGGLAVAGLMIAALLLWSAIGGPATADAAGIARPAAGGWKWQKVTTTEATAKSGSARISKGGKKLVKLKLKPSKIAETRCGFTKQLVLKTKLKIKKHNDYWLIGKVLDGGSIIGLSARFKHGGDTLDGFMNFSFYHPKKGSGSIRIDGCSVYFALKKK